MKFILGTKRVMSQVFDEEGVVHPVTILKAGPVVVTKILDKIKDGYQAVQVGFGAKKPKNINKAIKGQIKDLGNFAYIREFRIDDDKAALKVGDKIDVSAFVPGSSP